MLKLGSNTDEVTLLQKNLNKLGYRIDIDGDFGPETEKAVKGFQYLNWLTVDGIVGPKTQAAIDKLLNKLIISDAEKTPWMDWLILHNGEKEIPGGKDNPFIMDLYQYGNYPRQHDEVPWCAVCANAALMKTGYKGTGSAAAKSFKQLGIVCELRYGAIVVIRHPDGNHHIAFFEGWKDESSNLIKLRGGNQSNALKVSTFNVSGNSNGCDEIVAIRWPIKI